MKLPMKRSILTAAGILAAGFTFAADNFDAAPVVRRVVEKAPASSTSGTASRRSPSPAPKKGDFVKLKRGEIREVFRSSTRANPEMAFYLPPEGVHVVQVVIETKGSQVSYLLKALKPGKTVGGAVARQWLDREGFQPRNAADEARIQAAVKHTPLHIEVE